MFPVFMKNGDEQLFLEINIVRAISSDLFVTITSNNDKNIMTENDI